MPGVGRRSGPGAESAGRRTGRATLRAVAEEDVPPDFARLAPIEQSQSAMDAEIGRHFSARQQRPLAARADVRLHLVQRLLRAECLSALGFGLLLDLPPPRQVSAHRADDIVADD